MNEPQPDILQLSRVQRGLIWSRLVALRAALHLAVIGFVWSVFGLDLLGLDLLQLGFDEETTTTSKASFFGCISLLFFAYGLWDTRRGLSLALRGVLVKARVSSLSPLQKYGMVPLRYSFVLRGKSYGGACDVTRDQAGVLQTQDFFWLLVDAGNPRRSEYFEAIVPDGDVDEG